MVSIGVPDQSIHDGLRFHIHKGLPYTMMEKIKWGLFQNLLGDKRRCFCELCGVRNLCGIENPGEELVEDHITNIGTPPKLSEIPCRCGENT